MPLRPPRRGSWRPECGDVLLVSFSKRCREAGGRKRQTEKELSKELFSAMHLHARTQQWDLAGF